MRRDPAMVIDICARQEANPRGEMVQSEHTGQLHTHTRARTHTRTHAHTHTHTHKHTHTHTHTHTHRNIKIKMNSDKDRMGKRSGQVYHVGLVQSLLSVVQFLLQITFLLAEHFLRMNIIVSNRPTTILFHNSIRNTLCTSCRIRCR